MQIYLAKPGGQREGPYTLEQINRDLADRKYSDSDYWAWHEGLANWMPLHAVPGVSAKAGASVPPAPTPPTPPAPAPTPAPVKAAPPVLAVRVRAPAPAPAPAPARAPASASTPAPASAPVPAPVRVEIEKPSILVKAVSPETGSKSAAVLSESRQPEAPIKRTPEAPVKPEGAAPEPGPSDAPVKQITHAPAKLERPAAATTPEEGAAPAEEKVPSGLPFAALEQVFIFTSGEGRTVFESPAVAQRLQMSVGEPVSAIRGKVQVDVIGHVDLGVEEVHEDFIPEKAWRAMSIIKPAITQQARSGAYHVCVRPLLAEENEIVTLFLLYNKEKI